MPLTPHQQFLRDVQEAGVVGDWDWHVASNRNRGCGIHRQSREGRSAEGVFLGWYLLLNGEWVLKDSAPRGTVMDYRCRQDGWQKLVTGPGRNFDLVPLSLADVILEQPELRKIILRVHVGRLRMSRAELERKTMLCQRLREDLRAVLG